MASIILPEDVQSIVEARSREQGFAAASDYLTHLVRQDQILSNDEELEFLAAMGLEPGEGKIDVLLAAGDLEGARAEVERLCLQSLDSGDPILMTPEKWQELRLDLHREANLPS